MHFLGINLSGGKRKDSVANSGRSRSNSHGNLISMSSFSGSSSGNSEGRSRNRSRANSSGSAGRMLRRTYSGGSSSTRSSPLKSSSKSHNPPELVKKKKHDIRSRVDISPGVREICDKLADDNIMELVLGWGNESELRTKKDVAYLVKALRPATKIQTVRIGWRLSRLGKDAVVHQILPIVLDKPTLKNLQFIPESWVPEHALRKIVSKNSLVHLDIRATRLTPGRAASEPSLKPYKLRSSIFDSSSSTAGMTSASTLTSSLSSSLRGRSSIFAHLDRASRTPSASDDSDDFSECSIDSIIPFLSPTVKTLALMDCELLHEHMGDLCRHLHRRQHTPSPITSLSLRHNRELSFPRASDWAALLTLPHLQTLNVSLCDLDEADGERLAEALETMQPTSVSIRQLNIAGNYRMGGAIPRIVQAACRCLTRLDCSFCDVQNDDLSTVLNALADDNHAKLRAFIMQASRIQDASPLLRCLRNNHTLQSLVLHHPKESTPLSADGVAALAPALEMNYQMRDLRLDIERQHLKLKQQSDFWLQLNDCGRRILIQDDVCEDIPYDGRGYGSEAATTTTTTVLLDGDKHITKKLDQAPLYWPDVLAKAARLDNKNVLFWLVQKGAHHFADRKEENDNE